MTNMDLNDRAIEIDLALDWFEDFALKAFKGVYLSQKCKSNEEFTCDENYTRWIDGKIPTNATARLNGNTVINRCSLEFTDGEVKRIQKLIDELKTVIENYDFNGWNVDDEIRSLPERAESIFKKYERRRHFVLTFWNHTKSEGDESDGT